MKIAIVSYSGETSQQYESLCSKRWLLIDRYVALCDSLLGLLARCLKHLNDVHVTFKLQLSILSRIKMIVFHPLYSPNKKMSSVNKHSADPNWIAKQENGFPFKGAFA